MKAAHRTALADALRSAGVPLEDSVVGRVMHELRKRRYRLAVVSRGPHEAYLRHQRSLGKTDGVKP